MSNQAVVAPGYRLVGDEDYSMSRVFATRMLVVMPMFQVDTSSPWEMGPNGRHKCRD